MDQNFKKINKWPLGAGGINMHYAYWPPQLNLKVLPANIKQQVTDKYEQEFYPWIEDNWDRFTGVAESGISKQDFLDAPYGIKRFKGVINFMNQEDWSARLPETKQWLNLVNKQRNWGNKFHDVFPILSELL